MHRLILKFNLFRVSAKPIDGGSVWSLFLKCLPAGYFVFPTWIIPRKKVPVVITKFFAVTLSPYLLTTVVIRLFSSNYMSSTLNDIKKYLIYFSVKFGVD